MTLTDKAACWVELGLGGWSGQPREAQLLLPFAPPPFPTPPSFPSCKGGGVVLGTVTTKVLVREVEHGDYKGSMVGKGLFGVGEYDVGMMRKWV